MQHRNIKYYPNLKILLIPVLFIATFLLSFGQNDLQNYYTESLKINNTGMYVLGAWAITNMSSGAYGWSKNTGERMYFHQMNFFWNTINLSIAGITLYNNNQIDFSILNQNDIINKHIKTESIFLINSALDVGYIGAGLFLKHLSKKSSKRIDLLKGYGNSVILQGSFLLVFDLIMYSILKGHRMDFLNPINFSLSPELTELHFFIKI